MSCSKREPKLIDVGTCRGQRGLCDGGVAEDAVRRRRGGGARGRRRRLLPRVPVGAAVAGVVPRRRRGGGGGGGGGAGGARDRLPAAAVREGRRGLRPATQGALHRPARRRCVVAAL